MREPVDSFVDALPDLEPIIATEVTAYGWRGLTSEGEVFEVQGSNGHKAEVPSEIMVHQNGYPYGRRAVTNELEVSIEDYIVHFNRAVGCYRSNDIAQALNEAEETVALAPTLRAKFNRAMILLAAGHWGEGLREYWNCEQSKPFVRPQVTRALEAGLRPWRGERLEGKRLLVLHAHGFGDTIMCLRYMRELENAVMVMPPELTRLASQAGRVVSDLIDADYFCPILHLLHHLGATPGATTGRAYLEPDQALVSRWHDILGEKKRKRIGVAWNIGKPSVGDYPREVNIDELVWGLGKDADLFSVQGQGGGEKFGVKCYKFDDFSSCAAFMTQMDEIVSVDTAALHLAGAIGHPRVFGLLSHWASWRWRAKWYDNVTLCRQASEGDWASAIAQVG